MGHLCPSYTLVRDGRYSLRFRVPRDLSSHLGCHELVRALGTTDGIHARIIASRIALRLRRLWDLMREREARSAAELKALAVAWLKKEVAREWDLLDEGHFSRAIQDPSMPRDEARTENRELFGRDAALSLERVQERYRRHDYMPMQSTAAELLTGDDATEVPPRDRAVLAKMLMKAYAELQETKIAWSDGDVSRLPDMLVEAGRHGGQGVAHDESSQKHLCRLIDSELSVGFCL